MLRSQSISNISEQRKSKNGFLNALRPRKNSELNIGSTKLQKNPRPLSSSASSINLNQKYNEGLEVKSSYTTTIARRRTGVINKENYSESILSTGNVDSTKLTSKNKTLKTRSSAPNLKRQSMLISNPMVNATIPDQMDQEFSKMLSEKAPLDSHYLRNVNSSDTLYSINDIIDEQYSVKLVNFDEGDPMSDSDSFATLHRTTNMDDISGFVMQIDPKQERLPINNRKSLDLENLEAEKLVKVLNCEKDCFVSNLTLIENAIFLSSTGKTEINKRSCPLLDDINSEIMKSLKEDTYNEQNDYSITIINS